MSLGEVGHSDEITGLGLDALNATLVSSSKDKSVKIWDFYRCKLTKSVSFDFPVTNLCYNRVNDLVAIACSDLSITLLNGRADLKRVRFFEDACMNKITDLSFSQPDARWLLASSLDSCIRVWDIITGCLIDWIKFKNAPLSLDFSPSGEFLATSH